MQVPNELQLVYLVYLVRLFHLVHFVRSANEQHETNEINEINETNETDQTNETGIKKKCCQQNKLTGFLANKLSAFPLFFSLGNRPQKS